MEDRPERIFLRCLSGSLLFLHGAAFAQDQVIQPDISPQPVSEARIDSENVELTGFAGIMHIEDFGSSALWGGRLSWHLSETFFLEASAGFARAGKTSFEKLAGDVRLLTDDERDVSYYSLNLGINLLPGEAFVAGRYAFNTNFYVTGGAGATEFAGDSRLTFNLGVGYQVLLKDFLSVHVGFRQHAYRIELLGEDKTAFNPETTLGLSVFF